MRAIAWALTISLCGCGFDAGVPLMTEGGPDPIDLDDLIEGPDVLIDCDASFDSGTLAFGNWCGQLRPEPVVLTQPDGSEVVALPLGEFRIETGGRLRLTGTRPIALAVFGNATIAGEIDVSANGLFAGCLLYTSDAADECCGV